MQLSRDGTLEKYGVRLLGSPIEAIEKAEDREQFRETLAAMGQPVIPSATAETLEEASRTAEEIGYPVIIRPGLYPGRQAAAALLPLRRNWPSSPTTV